jgi:ribosomal protein S18 acetylase RimI-like enzyme
MEYIIRVMQPEEYHILEDFLYEAIFQRDQDNLLPRSVILEPGLHIYIKDFGKSQHDHCLCAEVDGRIVGAVWVRIIPGYGSIDDRTPEFAISLYKEYRGYGIGTSLMKEMLKKLMSLGYQKTSLAVQKDNYAYKMYSIVGFEIVDENEEEYIMICHLDKLNL